MPTAPTASSTFRIRSRLPANVLGRTVFSLAMVARVPYFAGVLPYVKTMEPGRCVVTGPKWFGVANHLGTFHVIAACNLAEAAMGMLMEATVPTTHRWIPKGMSVQYPAKGTTGLTATAVLEGIDFATITEGTDVVVPISVTDTSGTEVVVARITTWVTPRSPR